MVTHMALENAWLIIIINANLQNYYLIMETPATWGIPSTSVVSTVATGTGKKTQPTRTEFEPVSLNKEYIKYKDKHEKHAEVKMVSQIGKLLSGAGFAGDDIMVQGGAVKKKSN